MKKLILFLLLVPSLLKGQYPTDTYGGRMKSYERYIHEGIGSQDYRRNYIDTSMQSNLKQHASDTSSWEEYIMFRHMFYGWKPEDTVWTKEMEKSALSHGANLKKISAYESFYGKNATEAPPADVDVVNDLESSKDTSEETAQILGFNCYKLNIYKLQDTTIAKVIVNRPDETWKNWPNTTASIYYSGAKLCVKWGYALMAKASYAMGDNTALKKYGDVLESMGVNMDDVLESHDYKMAVQQKKDWQTTTTRTILFSVSVCRGDKNFTTEHVDKTGRNIYDNDDFHIQWNSNRWEVFVLSENTKTIWYYNEESTSPDPPSPTTGKWIAVCQSAQNCGSITSMDLKLIKKMIPLTASGWYEQSKTYRSKDDDHNEIVCLKKVVEDTTFTWKNCEDCHKAYGRLISMSSDRGGDEGAKTELKWTQKQVADKRIPTSEKMYTGLAIAYQRCYPPQTRNALIYWKLALEKQGQNSKSPTLSENEIVQIYQEMSKCYQLLGDEPNMKHYRCLGFGIGCGKGVPSQHKTGVGKSPNQN